MTRRCERTRRRRRDRAGAGGRALLALGAVMLAAACGGSTPATPTVATGTTTVGTVTHLTTVTSPLTTETMSEPPSTVVTTPTSATLVAPPPSTPAPAPKAGTCPYLTNAEVADANGQRTGTTSVIDVKPYPVCVFTRADGRFLAATRIVVADTPAEAEAAVNQHVPIDQSYPATHPAGWTGGAMATPKGLPDYPAAGSIYAVSKGKIAVIAISNQKQSIKGRQMVIDIVHNLKL